MKNLEKVNITETYITTAKKLPIWYIYAFSEIKSRQPWKHGHGHKGLTNQFSNLKISLHIYTLFQETDLNVFYERTIPKTFL